MVVASTVHRKQGPLSTNGGFELPLTNFALATALLTTGPGSLRLGPHLSKRLTRLRSSFWLLRISQRARTRSPPCAKVNNGFAPCLNWGRSPSIPVMRRVSSSYLTAAL